MATDGIFGNPGIRGDGSYIIVDGKGPDGLIGRLGYFLAGGTTGKLVAGETRVIQTPIGDSGRTFHLQFGSDLVAVDYGSEKRATEFLKVYAACSRAGLNPPNVISIDGAVLKFESIQGQSVIEFLKAAKSQGLLDNPGAVNAVNALTIQLLEDLVVFQFLDLPVPAKPCDYKSKIIESFERLLNHYNMHSAFERIGVSKEAVMADLDDVGQKLSLSANYRMRDADLSNVILDDSRISRALGIGNHFGNYNGLEVLSILNKGEINATHAAYALLAGIRHIDLDRADELSAGTDDFLRAISSVKGEHPLMSRDYFNQALQTYLGLINTYQGRAETDEMGRRFETLYPESLFFLKIRRGGDLCPEYTETIRQLVEEGCSPDSDTFNQLIDKAAGIEQLIGNNFNTASKSIAANPYLGENAHAFFQRLTVPPPNRENIMKAVLGFRQNY